MTIEIVDFPIKNGWIFHSFLYVYQRVLHWVPQWMRLVGSQKSGAHGLDLQLSGRPHEDLSSLSGFHGPAGGGIRSMFMKFHQDGFFTLWLCQNSYGKSPFLMGKSTISMVIFNSYFDITGE